MLFSVAVISFCVVFGGFFFEVAYFRFPDRLTIVAQGLLHWNYWQDGRNLAARGCSGKESREYGRESRSVMFCVWYGSIKKNTTRSTTLWRGMLTNLTHHEHFCLVAVSSPVPLSCYLVYAKVGGLLSASGVS